MNAVVSVVIPCYNQACFLAEAIESVLEQSYPHVEIVVVDDGSTDNTADVAGRYPGVRCIRQSNQGVSAARNAGLRESGGCYVVFLDADDRLLPTALEAGIEALGSCPECAFVFGQRRNIAKDGSPLPTREQPCVDSDHYVALLRENYIVPPGAVMYRRSVMETVGGFSVAVPATADYELYLRLARVYPTRCHGNAVVEYRRHERNMSTDYGLMLSSDISVLRWQRPYLRGDKRRERAYRAGLHRLRNHNGERLVVATRLCMLAGEYRRALAGLSILLRCYPRGLLRALYPRAAVTAVERVQNAVRRLWRRLLSGSSGAIALHPDPFQVSSPRFFVGPVTLSWTAQGAEVVEVHVGAPDGPLFSRTGPSGIKETGTWVHDGMRFYLQDVSDGLPLTAANTLATVRVKVGIAARSGGQPRSGGFRGQRSEA